MNLPNRLSIIRICSVPVLALLLSLKDAVWAYYLALFVFIGAAITDFADGKIAVITFPYAIKAALGLEDHHMSTLVDVARSLEGVMIAISVRQPGTDGSFQSKPESAAAISAAVASDGSSGNPSSTGAAPSTMTNVTVAAPE